MYAMFAFGWLALALVLTLALASTLVPTGLGGLRTAG